MKSRQKRLKAIELSLTPRQIVVVWLRNAIASRDLRRRCPTLATISWDGRERGL
jgi:hypothetical protein